MSGWPDIHEPFRVMARDGWGRLSPYRLGIIIGEHGGGLPAPPEYGERCAKTYARGIERGLINRAKQSRMK